MSKRTYIIVKESTGLYKLTISRESILRYDDVVWGDWKSKEREDSNKIEKYFEDFFQLMWFIVDDLVKWDNLQFRFRYEKSSLDNFLNPSEDDDKYNPIILGLKTGYVYVDKNYSYIDSNEKSSDFNSSVKVRRSIKFSNNKKEKEKECVSAIKIRNNPLKECLFFKEKRNESIQLVKDTIQEIIFMRKSIIVDIDIPVSIYYDDAKKIKNFDENEFLLVENLVKNLKKGELVFDKRNYGNIMLESDDINVNYHEKENQEEIKRLIDYSDRIIFKYLKDDKFKEICFKSNDFKSRNEFIKKATHFMNDLIKNYLEYHQDTNKWDKITTLYLESKKDLIMCIYENNRCNIENNRKYFNMQNFLEDIEKTLKEEEKTIISKNKDIKNNISLKIYNQKNIEYTKLKKDYLNNIIYFSDYHPYRIKDQINPKFDEISSMILDLKNEKRHSTIASTNLYNLIKDDLEKYIKSIGINSAFITIVPSHKENNTNPGMEHIVEKICNKMNFGNAKGMLYRYKTIEKLSKGGCRDCSVHFNSISVQYKVDSENIILLDDVTTTGNSMKACRKILEDEGYNVICICLAKTIHD